jgi:transposase InsO family protein
MVAISSLMSAAAFASDGTITITGAFTASSCTVTGSATNGDVAITLDNTRLKRLLSPDNQQVSALDMAYEQRGRPQGLLFHSDQGSLYASRLFRQRL